MGNYHQLTPCKRGRKNWNVSFEVFRISLTYPLRYTGNGEPSAQNEKGLVRYSTCHANQVSRISLADEIRHLQQSL